MNLIRNTFAKDAANRSILPVAQLKAKAKAFPLVKEQNWMNVKLLVILMSMVALIGGSSIAVSLATENQGAENIVLEGSKRGKVPFPHRRHQKNLGDCQICHSIFPQ
jgi:hypothetical protein